MRNWWQNLIFSRFPRPVIRSHRKTFRSSGKNHTQPVCGEHKTNSISSLLPFESLVHVESSCFTMLRGGHQEKKEKVSCASDLFGEDGNKTARRRLSRRKSIKSLSSSVLASITSSSEKGENWSWQRKMWKARRSGKQCDITSQKKASGKASCCVRRWIFKGVVCE